MDGVKFWLSKSKGSTKNLSDDGSLKSSRLVQTQQNEMVYTIRSRINKATGSVSRNKGTDIA